MGDNTGGIVAVIFASLLFIFCMLIIVNGLTSQEYKTDEIVDCNDKDGDIIPELTCYKVLDCSTKLKFMNEPGCIHFVGGGK